MDATLASAAEAVRTAAHLLDQYRHDAAALAGPGLHVESRLLGLDQNYAGIWEQLDRASSLLANAGRDVTTYTTLRATIDDPHAGYVEERQLTISLDGVSEDVRFRVNKHRLRVARKALGQLRELLPEVDWHAGDETDAEVARFLAGERGGKTALRLALWLGSIAAVVGGVIAVFVLLRPPDYGRHTGRLRALELELESRPCDKKRIVDLTELYNRASAYPRALQRAKTFFARCGEHDRLRWVTYSSCKYSGDHACAIAEVDKLIARHPNDKDYRWWRGEIYERQRKLSRAITDYRQAIALRPKLRSIPLRLARLLEGAGRPCEAIEPLAQRLYLAPPRGGASQLARQLEALRERPDCQSWTGKGTLELAPPAQGTAYRVMVRIGKAMGRFLIDRRLGPVLLRPAFARRAGLTAAAKPPTIVRTRWGHVEGPALRVAIAAGAANASQVTVVIADAGPPGDDGVLGLAFLLRFKLQEQGVVLRLVGAGEPTSQPAP